MKEKRVQGILQTKLNSSGALPAIHLYVLSIFKIDYSYHLAENSPSLKVDKTFMRGISCLKKYDLKVS